MSMRGLLWLVALVAFVVPSFAGPAALAATSAMDHAVVSDCGHDAPPPPCPESDTAKHAAGTCCPLMSEAVALLAVAPDKGFHTLPYSYVMVAARHLVGLLPHKDPPPPRV